MDRLGERGWHLPGSSWSDARGREEREGRECLGGAAWEEEEEEGSGTCRWIDKRSRCGSFGGRDSSDSPAAASQPEGQVPGQ